MFGLGMKMRTMVGAVATAALLVAVTAVPASASTPSSCRTGTWIEADSSNPSYLVGWKYLRRSVDTSAGYPKVYYVYQESRPVPRWPVGFTWLPVGEVYKRC